MLNSGRLLDEAEFRTDVDPVYYPVRIRSLNLLYEFSNNLLNSMVTVEAFPEYEAQQAQALETHAGREQIAA